jgi:outer membrane protein OmpA-like peptidoglycan-associated protein/polyisoprenoid-binding protein YceI
MHLSKIGVYLAFVLLAAAGVLPASAQNLLNQDWVLNANQSNLYVQTEKLESVVEKHRFTSIEGNISRDGDATIKIDLNTLDTGIDLRNVRMRFVLFETFKFPTAEITARLDKSKLTEIATRTRINYTLMARVNLHGIVKDIAIPVEIARLNDTTVTVSTIKPVVVKAETFDFLKGLAKLADAMGGIRIVPEASISFDLTFGTGSARPALEAARVEREKVKTQEAAAAISTEGCETRFTVMTESNAIYFKTGSAELEGDEPLLDTGADIAKRCPSVRFLVEGHTDNVGGKTFNQRLSEQRAKSVIDYLMGKGINAARIQSAGYGDTHPVAQNNSEANRAKNRRIEFKVTKN